MKQQYLLESIPTEKYDLLSKEELIKLNEANEDLNRQMRKYIEELHENT